MYSIQFTVICLINTKSPPKHLENSMLTVNSPSVESDCYDTDRIFHQFFYLLLLWHSYPVFAVKNEPTSINHHPSIIDLVITLTSSDINQTIISGHRSTLLLRWSKLTTKQTWNTISFEEKTYIQRQEQRKRTTTKKETSMVQLGLTRSDKNGSSTTHGRNLSIVLLWSWW
jgi:hypothetical protein